MRSTMTSLSGRRAHQRNIRRRRIRARLWGTAERPRLSVFRSHRHLTLQLVNDDVSRTLLGLTDDHLSLVQSQKVSPKGVERARALGKLLAERAKELGITRAVFDRGGYAYHGRVRAVVEGARDRGLIV